MTATLPGQRKASCLPQLEEVPGSCRQQMENAAYGSDWEAQRESASACLSPPGNVSFCPGRREKLLDRGLPAMGRQAGEEKRKSPASKAKWEAKVGSGEKCPAWVAPTWKKLR